MESLRQTHTNLTGQDFLHAGKIFSTQGLTEKQRLQEADRGGETAGASVASRIRLQVYSFYYGANVAVIRWDDEVITQEEETTRAARANRLELPLQNKPASLE